MTQVDMGVLVRCPGCGGSADVLEDRAGDGERPQHGDLIECEGCGTLSKVVPDGLAEVRRRGGVC